MERVAKMAQMFAVKVFAFPGICLARSCLEKVKEIILFHDVDIVFTR